MQPFTSQIGVACPLGLENVDTDQLIPARFMSRPRDQGYGNFLLHDVRFDGNGPTGFILDAPRYANSSILVARRNFGTGSSREAAVYALWDFGIRCVIAPSFGDIFAANAVKNGLLPAVLPEAEVEALLSCLTHVASPVMAVDLASQAILVGNARHSFTVDPVRRLQLINGWDDLDLTLRHSAEIAIFRERLQNVQPWTFPVDVKH